VTQELRKALRRGVLTVDQLRELIGVRAQRVDLSLDAAVEAFRNESLPNSAAGDDLALLIGILLDAEAEPVG
jgi:hypothetical protein